MEFLDLLRSVKPFLTKVCKNVFCITPVLTALKFWRPFWVILDNTLMVIKLNDFMKVGGGGLVGALCMGLFSVLNLFGGGGTHFQYFSLFLEKGSVCFQNILRYILGITLEITQKVIWYVAFVLQCCFKVF